MKKLLIFSSELNFEKLENWKTQKLKQNKSMHLFHLERKKKSKNIATMQLLPYCLFVCLFELSL